MRSNKAINDELDEVHSLFIRLRDCPDGRGYCISCNAPITPETCDNGHFMKRDHIATRWDEVNCNAQCRDCNRYMDGNEVGYEKGLIRKYGAGIPDELRRKKRTTLKLSRWEKQEMIKYYKQRIEELEAD